MERENVKIIFNIGNMSHSGGTERVLSVIANGLQERGYKVAIISLKGEGAAFFPLNEKINLYWLEKEVNRGGIIKRIHVLKSILKKENANFLIDVDIIIGFYSIFLKMFVPAVHWISWEHFNYYYHFRKNHNLRKIVRRLVCRFSEQLVVLSDEDKEYYNTNLKLKCGITRIYNPNPYENLPKKSLENKMIFAAGRLTKAKGFDLLLQSWSLLEKKYPEWTVVIAGAGEEQEMLEEKKRVLGCENIRFIGTVSNMEEYYEQAAIFVLPSRDEGFGMVLLEAMDFSLPVVSYSCKAGPREIVEDGVIGFLVEPGNVENFAEKMELLMKEEALRRKMGENAKASTKRFDKERILDEWEALLQKMSNK